MRTSKQKKAYRTRYIKVMEDLTQIANMPPRKRYMYRLMDSVIFHDFETALDVVIEDFQNARNDNRKI